MRGLTAATDCDQLQLRRLEPDVDAVDLLATFVLRRAGAPRRVRFAAGRVIADEDDAPRRDAAAADAATPPSSFSAKFTATPAPASLLTIP